jgi:uncharacterized lipoprotein YmbA
MNVIGSPPGSFAPIELGLGPIRFPAYLDRLEMVTRINENSIAISDTNRWAAPLDDAFTRILAQEPWSRMPDSRVALYPCYNDHVPDFQIIVDVRRFDATVQGLARLEASWIIRDAKTNTSLYSTSSAFTQSEQNDQLRQLARVNERSNSVPRPRVLLDPRSSVVSSPAMVVYSSASPASCVIVSSPGLGKITI